MKLRFASVSIVVLAGVVGLAEMLHWRASRRRLGSIGRAGATEAIVVLGYKNRGGRANHMNRFRVRVGLRSQDLTVPTRVLVFCGGGVVCETPEAELMARYARDECGYTGILRLDYESTSTWENIENAIPLIEDADTIKIVSNSLHAEKGRAFLRMQRPDLAERLVRAKDYRFGERAFLKPLLAIRGMRDLRGL